MGSIDSAGGAGVVEDDMLGVYATSINRQDASVGASRPTLRSSKDGTSWVMLGRVSRSLAEDNDPVICTRLARVRCLISSIQSHAGTQIRVTMDAGARSHVCRYTSCRWEGKMTKATSPKLRPVLRRAPNVERNRPN